MLGSIEMILIDNAKSYSTSPLEGTDLAPIQDLSESIENNIVSNRIEKPDIAFIESTTRVALKEQSSVALIEVNKNNGGISIIDSPENQRLTDDEKAKIKEETSWSDEIIDNIQNIKQYENLKSAGLVEAEINGRKCLIKENIDLDYTDDDGISNRDRITRGLAPLDNKTGKPLELHHLGQKADSPLIELTVEEHRTGEYEDGKKNQSLWHDNTLETEVHGEGNSWTQERKEHWKARSEQNLKGNE